MIFASLRFCRFYHRSSTEHRGRQLGFYCIHQCCIFCHRQSGLACLATTVPAEDLSLCPTDASTTHTLQMHEGCCASVQFEQGVDPGFRPATQQPSQSPSGSVWAAGIALALGFTCTVFWRQLTGQTKDRSCHYCLHPVLMHPKQHPCCSFLCMLANMSSLLTTWLGLSATDTEQP